MVLRSIPELLDDSSNHISIAIARHLKGGSPLPSSSSDSDEDIDELPFIPMPLHMEFSGSRISLTDIQTNDSESRQMNGNGTSSGSPVQTQEMMECEAPEMGKTVEVSSKAKSRYRRASSQDNDKSSSDEEPPAELPQKSELSRKPLQRGSSVESDKPVSGPRRGELRRGGSADSALLLRIKPEEEAGEGSQENGRKVLKKAVSMELPRRSPSPGTTKMSQEDYALKLEMMRQRLLRGGSVDNKMSGLRGPLLETLGMGEEKRPISSDRFTRTNRLCPPPLVRAASSESPRDDVSKSKVLRKSASFSQGDSEPIILHRRSGAPLEIPLAQTEERRLKEAISMSALTEQINLNSRPVTPREPSPRPPTPESVVQESPSKTESEESLMEKEIKTDEITSEKMDGLTTDCNFDERSSTSGFSEKDMSISEEPMVEAEYVDQRVPTPPSVVQSSEPEEKMDEKKVNEKECEESEEVMEEEKVVSVSDVEKENVDVSVEKIEEVEEVEEVHMTDTSSEMVRTTSSVVLSPTQENSHPPTSVVPTYVTPSLPPRVVLPDGTTSAYASIMQTIIVPSLQPVSESSTPTAPAASTPAALTETFLSTPSTANVPSALTKPASASSTEHPAVYSRVASPELISKEPSPPRLATQFSSQQELSAGADLEDITSEEVFEARFKKRESSLSRSLKFLSRSRNDEKSLTSSDSTEAGEEIYRPGPIGAPLELGPRRLEEKSKSVQDLREAQKDQGFMRRLSMRLKRSPSTERKEDSTKEEDSGASRRRLSWSLGRRGSQDKKEVEMTRTDKPADPSADQEEKEVKKPNESPVLAMRRKIESTVAGISTRIRSYSEERRSLEEKEQKRTPILSILRRATSETRNIKVPNVQNQLAAQTGTSSESLDTMSPLRADTSRGI